MASYFQSYFRTSSMPKRLLQYALSRLEILDTEALGLDNLDIALGKNSEFVFRDVGLKLRKLEALLQLPPSFEFSKAKVLLLRITIPVDIYSSPILVEVDGVECQLRVPGAKTGSPTSPTNHDRNRRRPASNKLSTDQSHTRVHHGRRGSDSVDDEDELESAIPTAADLAQSFLQTEPKAEKAELEAAIISETQDLTSSVSSDDGEEIPVGTGTALSLPAFMTNFLQGVVDRLQVKVRGISLNLDVDIPNESGQASPSHTTDPVTVQIKIDNVDIEGVTHEAKDSERVESKPAAKHGKRLIFLSRIRGVLITEANVFSSLARSSAFSSPVTTHSEIFNDRKSSSRYSSARESSYKSLDESISPEQTSVSSSSQLSSGPRPPTNDSNQMQASVIVSDSGRFDDASDDGADSDSDGVPPADLLVSAMAESIYDNSAYLDQITQSQYADDDESIEGSQSLLRFGKEVPTGLGLRASPMSTPRTSTPLVPRSEEGSNNFASRESNQLNDGSMPYSVALPRRERPRFSEQRVSQSQPTLPADLLSSTGSFSRSRQEVHLISGSISRGDATSDDGSEASTPLGEDLAESQLFSHEDAESMYLSAISHGSSPGARVPGGWAGSDHGDDTVEPGAASPLSPEAADEPLDNLEHARHITPLENSSEFHDIEESASHASPSPQQSRILSSCVPAPASSPNTPALPQNPSNVSERSATSSEDFTRMTKQIFSLDQIAIYIPGTSTPTEIISESSDLAYGSGYGSTMFASNNEHNGSSYSVAPGIPGAFSVHEARKSPPPKATIPPPKVTNPLPTSPYDPSIEVTLGQLLTQFDISVGRLIWRLVCKIQEALKQMPATPSQTTSDESSAPDKHFKIRAEQISVKFLERLQGTSSSPVPTLVSEQWSNPPEADILLRTTFKGLEITSDLSEALTKTSLTLQKFSFGYAQEDIVSFNADLQMRASVRDLAASAGVDLSVNIYQTSDTTRCEISTLPLHVSIDLQRLDETFSWFGGLSSVLNMGSSMVSNATITSASPSPSKPKPRGVRFEAPIKPDDKSLAAQNKVDARIGGFILDLVGKDCSIGVETSSVKIVSRDEGIGVSIQKIRLSGPHLRLSNNDPAIVMEIIATRIEFLPTPKDVDLDRLLSLITPSKAKYDQHDDILLDTLLRQRKQGAVLRLTVDDFKTRIGHLDELNYLPELGEEISRLSTVAKYLPDDDRPGLLSLITVRRFNTQVDVGQSVGSLQLASTDIEIAQISLPALVALSISTVSAHRNGTEELLGVATDPELCEPRARAPAIMARMIGDEMEPIVKIKLWNLKVEYRVPTLMAILGLAESATAEDLSASLSASVATLTGLARQQNPVLQKHTTTAVDLESGKKPMTIDVVLRDCIVGLNPLGLPSQVLLVLTESHIAAVLPKDQNSNATVEIGKASILVIDNVAHLASGNHSGRPRRESFDGGSSQVADLCSTGFVSVGYMSSAKAIIHVTSNNGEQSIDVELRDDLFVLESCADSTQTLMTTLNGLTPPTPPSKETKYRTKVIPVKDLLASLSGDAFGTAEGEYDFDDDFGLGPVPEDGTEEDVGDLEFDSHYIKDGSGLEDYDEARSESEYGDESLASVQLTSRDTHDGVLLENFAEEEEELENEPLDFQENHFGSGSVLEGTAHQWNSAKNTYDKSNAFKVRQSPFKVCVRDVHVIWNLFDGYDWQHTRDTITRAVQDVESKAIEKRSRSERRPQFEQDFDEEETVIGDFLFNSIYIGIPANRDPRELAAAINQGLNDDATETESVATTTFSSSPSRQGGSRRVKPKKLRLNRSKHHKITFELRGVCVDLVTFPPGSGETQSSIDVRVHDFEIFDHIPTSTWRKFATYMHDAGERETGASQIHIEILNVKPIPELAASEIVLKATVLPLRLHVDQDALDFITRFFEFKDDSVTKDAGPGDVPFLQRVEVNSVQVKLDFKPKRVDYAGLRSGHTTEFMNFLILDEADMVLRHTIIYGISGFDKMGKCLNDIWMPDIKRNQLPGILAGLAPVRSLVNVGGGLQQLVVVPLHEYKKDGRVVRSISKGAAAFAKTTGTELVKLGAKVAIGMQTVLQGAEGFLGQGEGEHHFQTGFETDEPEEESKQISLYANQPVGVFQGLRGGYAGLQRDLLIARDAIIAVPGEVMEEGTAAGVLRAVRKHAPTVILRPAIGVAKAGGQILMGATNSMDPANLKKAGDKYKSH